jgi:ribosomal protein S27AE
MTLSVVEELMLHNRSCPQCCAGEPCLVAEHIEDSWPRRVALEAAASLRKISTLDEALAL